MYIKGHAKGLWPPFLFQMNIYLDIPDEQTALFGAFLVVPDFLFALCKIAWWPLLSWLLFACVVLYSSHRMTKPIKWHVPQLRSAWASAQTDQSLRCALGDHCSPDYFPLVLSNIRATVWQNQQNDTCAQRRLRSAWASTQTDQSLCCARNG